MSQENAQNCSDSSTFEGSVESWGELARFIKEPTLKNLGKVNYGALAAQDHEFMKNLNALGAVDPDILRRVVVMRVKLANDIKLTQAEASELLESLHCKGFSLTDLNISGYTFGQLDLSHAVVGGEFDANFVTVAGDNCQSAMRIGKDNNQEKMKVGGDNVQEKMEVGGHNCQWQMEVGGNNYQSKMKVGRTNNQPEMDIGGNNYQNLVLIGGMNVQSEMRIGGENDQNDMKVGWQNDQDGMEVGGKNFQARMEVRVRIRQLGGT